MFAGEHYYLEADIFWTNVYKSHDGIEPVNQLNSEYGSHWLLQFNLKHRCKYNL